MDGNAVNQDLADYFQIAEHSSTNRRETLKVTSAANGRVALTTT